MIYTIRYCHLKSIPNYVKGSQVKHGDRIGRMGSTGKSSSNHVHLDLIQGVESDMYRLADISGYISDLDQLHKQYYFFLDSELFKYPLVITSYFGDPGYINKGEYEFHPAYDIVPENRHECKDNFNIYWNRSMPGKVVSVGFDDAYGYNIGIAYEA